MSAQLGAFAKVTKGMSDEAFLECVKEKLMGQSPHQGHLARMKCIAMEMCCCIKKNCGDMMKAMMSEDGCKLMAEWNLLCFDKNGDNVLDKGEFKSLMQCMAKKMMNKELTEEECEKKFKMADEDGDGAVVLAEFQAFMMKVMPMMCAMMKCPFFKVTKDMSDAAFLECVKEKLMGQSPC